MRASDIRPATPEDQKTDAAFQAASEISCRPSWTCTDSKKHIRAGDRSVLHYADKVSPPESHFPRLFSISWKTNRMLSDSTQNDSQA
jgi:hypothetical protein